MKNAQRPAHTTSFITFIAFTPFMMQSEAKQSKAKESGAMSSELMLERKNSYDRSGGCWLLAGGCWLVPGAWCLVPGGWSLLAGGWWLVVVSWCRGRYRQSLAVYYYE